MIIISVSGSEQCGGYKQNRTEYQQEQMRGQNRIPIVADAWSRWKVLDSCVVPASTYGMETVALSELHQHKLKVCEDNWIRRIVGVKRAEENYLVGKIDKSRNEMGWTHGQNYRRVITGKKDETKKQGGCWKRRPQLRWADSLKRDLRKAEKE